MPHEAADPVRCRCVTHSRAPSSVTARTEDWKSGQVHDAIPRSGAVDSQRFWVPQRFVKWTDLIPLPLPNPQPSPLSASAPVREKTDHPVSAEAADTRPHSKGLPSCLHHGDDNDITGPDWYRLQVAPIRGIVTGASTPGYLFNRSPPEDDCSTKIR